jgi:hypothetical protein
MGSPDGRHPPNLLADARGDSARSAEAAYEANGEFSDVTCIRRPYDDSLYFPEVLAILATVAGNPPHEPNSDFSRASVHIVADEFLNGEPREVMAELLG